MCLLTQGVRIPSMNSGLCVLKLWMVTEKMRKQKPGKPLVDNMPVNGENNINVM